MAILLRRDQLTNSRVYEPVNLISALGGGTPVPLRGDDVLFVLGQSDIEFLNSAPVKRIVLGQPNPIPQCRSLQRLEDIVADTQSSRFSQLTRGSFIIKRNGRNDLDTASLAARDRGNRENQQSADAASDDLNNSQRQRAVSLQSARTTGDLQVLSENGTQIRGNADERDRDSVIRLQQQEREQRVRLGGLDGRVEEVCPTAFEDEPELLSFLIEHTVGVGGAVHRPGAYPVAGSVSVEVLLAVAQGVAGRAEDAFLDVTRSTSTNSTTERFAVDAAGAAVRQVTLRSGDDVRFNAGQLQAESGAVLLAGEFQRPGLYTFRKGETLSQLMVRAGGLTPQAYTYGSIYTRASVKVLQQEGIQRTARELNAALLAAMSRRSGDASGLAGATQLIRELSDLDVPGRMVVETDPGVLAVRPEFDTVLEAGDAIYIPKRPNFVLVLGDVNNPTALQFVADKDAREYVSEAGGTSASADKARIFVVLPNGTAEPFKSRRETPVPPGSVIIVPKNIDPLRTLDFLRDVTQIFAQIVTSIDTIAILATN